MRTMVLGRMGAERARLERMIVAAGHDLDACHDRSWGCIGMDGGCPLDEVAVDVAIAVAEPGGRFDPQGVACAHRARIPIVAVGATEADPVLDYVVANVPHGDESVLVAMEAAATDAGGHRFAVKAALVPHHRAHESIHVSVERSASNINVLLTVANVDEARAAALADIARAAVRAFDPHVNVIDVSVVAGD